MFALYFNRLDGSDLIPVANGLTRIPDVRGYYRQRYSGRFNPTIDTYREPKQDVGDYLAKLNCKDYILNVLRDDKLFDDLDSLTTYAKAHFMPELAQDSLRLTETTDDEQFVLIARKGDDLIPLIKLLNP